MKRSLLLISLLSVIGAYTKPMAMGYMMLPAFERSASVDTTPRLEQKLRHDYEVLKETLTKQLSQDRLSIEVGHQILVSLLEYVEKMHKTLEAVQGSSFATHPFLKAARGGDRKIRFVQKTLVLARNIGEHIETLQANPGMTNVKEVVESAVNSICCGSRKGRTSIEGILNKIHEIKRLRSTKVEA